VAHALLTHDGERERLFRRAVGWSAAAHAVLLLLMLVSPFPRSRTTVLPGVMNVSLVAAAPSAPARAPARTPPPPTPKPEAKPEPKPEPPPPPKPEVKADKKLLPKESLKQPKPEPPKPKPAPEKPLEYQDALASLRDELGEQAPEEAADPELLASVQPGPRAGTPGQGPGDPIDPAVAEWIRRVKIHVKRNWVQPPGMRRQAIEAEVSVTLDATGNVLGTELTRRSGNPGYDEGVLRALEKSSPLPPPPESGDWVILFNPQEML
jgi:colicin import membrane protein